MIQTCRILTDIFSTNIFVFKLFKLVKFRLVQLASLENMARRCREIAGVEWKDVGVMLYSSLRCMYCLVSDIIGYI